ncbi:MAG: hypothetical protein P9L99_00020 [Candidatus Lernaella stagnicola]|nr:hypothetical protein [Candidatus Lernaella stagnicola]
MKSMKYLLVLLALFAVFVGAVFSSACDDDDDDDDNDDNDDNNDDTPVSPAECIPENASEKNRQVALEILEYYVGEYEDGNERLREVTCDPDGDWYWPEAYDPNSGITYYYALPLRVEYVDEQTMDIGQLEVAFDPVELDAGKEVNEWIGFFYVASGEMQFQYSRISGYNESPVVMHSSGGLGFPLPDDGWEYWTKTD